jgi:DNA-binding NarL/FixJ family response regulator
VILCEDVLFKKEIMMAKKKVVTGVFSKEETNILKKMYPNTSTKDVAKKLNRKPKSVEAKASNLGLKKSSKYLKKAGLRK